MTDAIEKIAASAEYYVKPKMVKEGLWIAVLRCSGQRRPFQGVVLNGAAEWVETTGFCKCRFSAAEKARALASVTDF